MTKPTIDEKLNETLLNGVEEAEDIIAEFTNPDGVIDGEILVNGSGKKREIATRVEVNSNPMTGDLFDDYAFARDNLYNLVERGNDALEGIIELAKEMEHPRAYEVAAGLIKTVTESTMELMKIQKELQNMKGEKPKGSTTTNNNLYVGSTAELQSFLKDREIK
jgi:hypothetical protein